MLKHKWLFLCGAPLLVVGCADEDPADEIVTNGTMAASTAGTGPSPAAAAMADSRDGSLLTIAGKVVAAAPEWFRLRTGDEEITVEMDDWDWYQEGKAIKVGDQVTVTGRVDKGLWEQSRIEASSVFVRNLGVSFLANGADEEERTAALVQVGQATTSALGHVSNVEGQELTVGSIDGPIRVDVSQLASKPKVQAGDAVYTWGNLDVDPAEGVEMMALGLTVLSADTTKQDEPDNPEPQQQNSMNAVG